MIKTSIVLLFAGVVLAQPGVPPLGPAFLMSGSGAVQSGINIRFASYAIPGGQMASRYGTGGIAVDATTMHRSVIDSVSGDYFGYDLSFQGNAAGGYQAVFQALTRARKGARVIVPKLPAPQPIKDGDTIAMEIMESSDGTQRIQDYIQVFLAPRKPAAATTKAEPRDYTVDDGFIMYDTSTMTVWIDGQEWKATPSFTGKPGATFWISFPDKGRYVLSLIPHEGFEKSGAIRDNVASFSDGGHSYEIRFMSPIAPTAGSGKAWNLYLLHDTSYRPNADMQGAVNCGVDRIENLVR